MRIRHAITHERRLRWLRPLAVSAAGVCLALAMVYAAFAQAGSSPGPAELARSQMPSGPLTHTVYLPLILHAVDVRFATIGYDCCGNPPDDIFEHIHFRNFGSSAVDITGWRINSPATGDSYVFPTASAPPFSTTNKEITLNTHYAGDVDNISIFDWNQVGKDEWPSAGGTAYLYDAANNLVATCHYTPSANDGGNATCQ